MDKSFYLTLHNNIITYPCCSTRASAATELTSDQLLQLHQLLLFIVAGMSPWWQLLELLSWSPIFNSSHCSLFEDGTPLNSICRCSILKWEHRFDHMIGHQDSGPSNGWQGTWHISPAHLHYLLRFWTWFLWPKGQTLIVMIGRLAFSEQREIWKFIFMETEGNFEMRSFNSTQCLIAKLIRFLISWNLQTWFTAVHFGLMQHYINFLHFMLLIAWLFTHEIIFCIHIYQFLG